MKSNQISIEREAIVFHNIRELVYDLRYVDVADYVTFMRYEQLGNLADIVNSAAELFFYPETLRFGHGGEVEINWDSPPKVALDLEFRNLGVDAYFRLIMAAEVNQIVLHHLAFNEPKPSQIEDTQLLAAAFANARIPRRNEIERRA